MSDALQFPSPSGRGARGEGRRVKLQLPSDMLDFARQLRREQTHPETLVWHLLRGRRLLGLKFRRQHPLPPYILDFYCEEAKLAIELDGGQHNEDRAASRDDQRDRYIRSRGIEVLRYWNHDVMQRTEDVLEDLIRHASQKVRPSPPAPLSSLRFLLRSKAGRCILHRPFVAPASFARKPARQTPMGEGREAAHD